MRVANVIDLHKGSTIVICLCLMVYYKQWENQTLWAYTALHSAYGILWVLKSAIYPDKSWETPTSGYVEPVAVFMLLASYWASPWSIAAFSTSHHPAYLCLCTIIGISGMFTMFVADMQKQITLSLKVQKLTRTSIDWCEYYCG